MSFNSIPDDILLCISRWIPIRKKRSSNYVIRFATVDPHSLLQLVLCSRHLRQLLEPVLYESFAYNQRTAKNGTVKFLMRILERPDLARRVKLIHTRASHPKTESRDDRIFTNPYDATCLTAEDWARIRSKVDETGQSSADCDNWVKEIEKGSWDAITSLILTLTPNLEVLEFMEWSNLVVARPSRWAYPLLWRVLHHARQLQLKMQTKNPHGLWKLKRVRQESWYLQEGINIDCLLPFLAIPSLEIFWANTVNDEYNEPMNNWHKTSLTFPNVKELSLRGANIHQYAITHFLGRFPNLKRFCYRRGNADGYRDIEPPLFMQSISYLKPYLEDLTLLNDSRFKSYEHHLQSYPLGSLATFQNLRRLDINWQTLTGGDLMGETIDGVPCRLDIVDAIPTSLEWLRLRDTRDIEIVPAQTLMLLEQKHRFPSLKKLDLEWERYSYPDKPWFKEPFEHPGFTKVQSLEVLAKCREVGVEIVMESMPPPSKAVRYLDMNDPFEIESFSSYLKTIIVEYPYDDYERICKEKGCDLATGFPLNL